MVLLEKIVAIDGGIRDRFFGSTQFLANGESVRDLRKNKVASGDEEASGHDSVPEHRLGGQSYVLCPDGLPVYRQILCPHNTVIQSSRLSIHIFQQVMSPD